MKSPVIINRGQMYICELESDLQAHVLKELEKAFEYKKIPSMFWESAINSRLDDLTELIDIDRYNYEDWSAPRRCKICDCGMWEGYCFPEAAETFCSDECLHKEVTPLEYRIYYLDDVGFWTEWADGE